MTQIDVSDAQVEEFQRNGVVLLKGAFADHVDTLRSAIPDLEFTPGLPFEAEEFPVLYPAS